MDDDQLITDRIGQIHPYLPPNTFSRMPTMPSLFLTPKEGTAVKSSTNKSSNPEKMPAIVVIAKEGKVSESGESLRKIAFGLANTQRVTTLMPFLNTKSNLVLTTDMIHRRSSYQTAEDAAIKARIDQYHFLAPRLVPTKHLHPLHIPPEPKSDFCAKKESGNSIIDEIGVPSQLVKWTHGPRKGRDETLYFDHDGLADLRIKKIRLLISSHRWNGGGDVRMASNGALIYTIHRKSVANKQALVLKDKNGRSIWKICERAGVTGWNYDFHHSVSRELSSKKGTPSESWHLIGTFDRISPSASTGPANTVFGTLTNKCFASKKPVMNLKHDNFCGRVGVGGVCGIASPTGCAGDSLIQPFTRLLLTWHGWKTHTVQSKRESSHIHDRFPTVRAIEDNQDGDRWETKRDGVSSSVMIGDPTATCYRFLDEKSSKHSGTFLKLSDAEFSSSIAGASLDRWELVIKPPVVADKSKSDNLKCVRRSMPPEMMLAAGLVAQMMVDRKTDGRLNCSRGLVESEMGKGLGRSVGKPKRIKQIEKLKAVEVDVDTISYF
ncbi:hypothetical protein BC830DRAFT_1104526 [Chytriomyces sp. MP71]|nr:hypothetical protein BC830DRAFT_1104526 [Chytriomyces sp. MP71]